MLINTHPELKISGSCGLHSYMRNLFAQGELATFVKEKNGREICNGAHIIPGGKPGVELLSFSSSPVPCPEHPCLKLAVSVALIPSSV